MSDDLIFDKPEPKKTHTRWDMETEEHISWRLEKERYDKFNSVPKVKRQEILEEFKKGGINIQELAKKHKIKDSMIVADIIYLNIKTINIFRGESL
jgi:hypothetical protein